LSFAGSATITAGADSTQPPTGQIVMGATGNTLAIFRLTETSNVENVKVTDMTVRATTGAGNSAAFSNVTLWNGSTLLGTAGSASSVTGGYDYTFHLGSALVVPQANSISVTLKGDAASWASQGALPDATSTTFGINSTASITALGATSNKTTSVTSVSGATGNAQTVLRSTLTVSAAALGGSAHTKQTNDDLGTITFTANAAGPVALGTTTITLSSATGTPSLKLIDQNGLDAVTAGEATTTISGATKTWTFINGFNISAGGSYTFKVRFDSTSLPQAGSVSQSISASIQNNTDVRYTDGLDASSTANIALPTVATPITINSVTYPSGQ